MHETLIGGSGAHGEQPNTAHQERGALHAPMNGKRVIATPEESAAFREHLARVRASVNEGLSRAGSIYEAAHGAVDSERATTAPKTSDHSLQEEIRRGNVLIEGTPEGNRFKQLRDQLKQQIPAHPTQQTGGLFQRFRHLFR